MKDYNALELTRKVYDMVSNISRIEIDEGTPKLFGQRKLNKRRRKR